MNPIARLQRSIMQWFDPIKVRPMVLSDVPNVYAIERLAEFCWTQEIIHDCIVVGYSCWVLEEQGQIRAFAIMSFKEGKAHLLNITVHPEAQRRGFATQLLNRLLAVAKGQKAHCLYLEVRASNKAAMQLYKKFGFHQTGVREGYYPAKDGSEDAISFSIDL